MARKTQGVESVMQVSIPPNSYIHTLDINSNVTRVIVGPQRYTNAASEEIVAGPLGMITVPPRCYIIIENPHVRDAKGVPELDAYGQVRLKYGEQEIRMPESWPEPFPLYPGEKVLVDVTKLRVVEKNSALRLKALRNFTEDSTDVSGSTGGSSGAKESKDDFTTSIMHQAGDEWLFKGPGTLVPRIEVEVIEEIEALVIKHSQALKLRARRQCTDFQGKTRCAGEEWLVREPGAYLPSVEEEVVQLLDAIVLTDKTALHLQAAKTFTDVYGILRKAGSEWLVTVDMSDSHILDVYEDSRSITCINTLSNREFCVVLNPYIDGVQKLGVKISRVGEQSFFLQPGEVLEAGIQQVLVLAEDEALLLQAIEEFEEAEDTNTSGGTGGSGGGGGGGGGGGVTGGGRRNSETDDGVRCMVKRRPGDRWMVYGAREYIPPVEVVILERRKAIPLDVNEGIYVRDNQTGKVRAVIGQTTMLKTTEELWEKDLPQEVEALLEKQAMGINYITPAGQMAEGGAVPPPPRQQIYSQGLGVVLDQNSARTGRAAKPYYRDKTRVINFRVSENSAVQVYDYKSRSARVVFGPDQIMLNPDEQFSVMRLSGDKPKRPNVITSLCLNLGPDFMTDVLIVETSDHARLQLTLSYNWRFNVDKNNVSKIFSVRDFTGDACKTIASKVRGAVAMEAFDTFHKHSARIIRTAVLGVDDKGKCNPHLSFEANGLEVTNIDIQTVEPVDKETRISLQKSVQMAIDITTNSQQARAKHNAFQEEEEAQGLLEQQRLRNSAAAEQARKQLIQLQADTKAIEAAGAAKGEAMAKAEAAMIEGEAAVSQARHRAEADNIAAEGMLNRLRKEREAEFEHAKKMAELEVDRAHKLAEIEQEKFARTVSALGQETIVSIARAGPEMQAKLLGGLGLKTMMITDGSSPINLFDTAKGLLGDHDGGNAHAGGAGSMMGKAATVAAATK